MKSVSLHTNCSHSKYEKYREAWELLGRDPNPNPEGHIDSIQGCAEEFPAEPAQPMPPQAGTKIPRIARDDNFYGALSRRLFVYTV
jgi:hypothetical protein